MKAISFRLNREALELLNNAPEKIQFELNGSDSAMVIGGKSFSVNVLPDPTIAHELYRSTSGINIEHVANVTHRAMMKQVLSQEDKSWIRSRTEAAEREKNARRIELLDGPNMPSPRKAATPIRRVVSPSSHRASPRSNTTPNPNTTPTPTATPSTVASTAVAANSTSSTTASSTSSTLRERLIHLLAIQPLPLIQLTAPLRTRDEDLIPVLKKVASLSKGNWRLRSDIYPEIKIWEWRYDEKERNIVIKNAQEAYKVLNLPRNAPERNNLQPKKSHHLVPPPPQRSTITTPTNNITNMDITSSTSSPPRKRPAPSSSTTTTNPNSTSSTATTNNNNNNNDTITTPSTSTSVKKKKKQKTSRTKSSTSTSTSTSTPSSSSSTAVPPPAAVPQRSAVTSSSTKDRHRHPNHHQQQQPLTTAIVPDNTSSESEDEYNEPFSVARITNQAEFLTTCKRHDEAQSEYIHLKNKIIKDHPHYIEALAHVDNNTMESTIANEDENELRTLFYRKLRSIYLSRGGKPTQWRAVMQLCRQFNWTLAKVNTLWDEIERAYTEHHFSLPA
ncbi:hypothetical protein INT45_002640 [Circinella minor]|uniref:RNA polymerase II elongation factor ELL N-terminal domain-containing protein n=1 Tax=Circinella minor TaxID=1195481 RepID=A0A8H7S355_9FUNG|nr:hypothetical protein INT45_002640 [Circinella minor]